MDPKAKPAQSENPAQPETEPPKQQLGDTPVAPWEMPTPEEKAKAEPVREALEKVVEKVDTPEKADQVAESLERKTGNRTAAEVEQTEKARQAAAGGNTLAGAAQAVQQAAKGWPPAEKPPTVIAATLKTLEQAAGR